MAAVTSGRWHDFDLPTAIAFNAQTGVMATETLVVVVLEFWNEGIQVHHAIAGNHHGHRIPTPILSGLFGSVRLLFYAMVTPSNQLKRIAADQDADGPLRS